MNNSPEHISIPAFIATYHPGLTYPAVVNAIHVGKVDAVRGENNKGWVILLTERTLRYQPINSTRRDAKHQQLPEDRAPQEPLA